MEVGDKCKMMQNDNTTEKTTNSQIDLNNMMRMLWEQHVYWTRMAIISAAENIGDVNLVTKRLLKNPTDFENALLPYYGKEKAEMFSELLKEHLLMADQLVKAAKAGNSNAAADIRKKWYANADDIANFLSEINPYWSVSEVRRMFYDHLAMTESEAISRLNKDYAADIMQFDKIEQQALKMADMFTKGIIQQFPKAFIY